MAAFTWGPGGSQMTPEEIAAQRKVAQAMMAQGADYSPVQSWTQGAARVAQALFGGMQARDANEAAKANAAYDQEVLTEALSSMRGQGGAPTAAPAAAPASAPAAAGDAASAIASIESGGKYDLLGPVTKTGDRAYGKYQVMGANVPVWTKAHLGREMTPQEFLASPEAQDAVFKGQFGQYSQKYGPEGAAKAWFAGESGMKNPNARDQLGTTVQAYADRFNKAYGTPPAQVASADPAALPVNAQSAEGYAIPGQPAPAVQAVAQAMPASGVNPRIMAAMASPYISDGTKRVLGIMLQSQMKDQGSTDEIKEYKFDAAQRAAAGLPPIGFSDWKTALKKAGATNVTTNVDKGESSFAKAAGAAQAKRFDDLAADGQQASQMISDINTLTDLGKNIGTGKGAEFKAAVGPYAEALGIKVDGLSDIQAYEAIVNRVAPTLRVKGSGAQSDYELKNFLKSLPSLGNTPEGNALAAEVLKGLQENKVRAAEIGSMALNGQISREEAEKRLRELPDPMTNYREFTKANRPAARPAGAPPPPPQPGEIRDGYRFKGGNPADPKNWEQFS